MTKIPFLAAKVVVIVVTAGIAKPKACGHVITTTVIASVRANTNVAPSQKFQAKKVSNPTVIAIIVSQCAARSANFCDFGFDDCACLTSSTICDKAVSSPTFATLTVKAPSTFKDPPITSSPAFL